ncbi:MAG: hypothetical protein ABW252_00855 [Polyangiales bacterium]
MKRHATWGSALFFFGIVAAGGIVWWLLPSELSGDLSGSFIMAVLALVLLLASAWLYAARVEPKDDREPVLEFGKLLVTLIAGSLAAGVVTWVAQHRQKTRELANTEAHARRGRAETMSSSLADFRAALQEFGSSCVPQSLAKHDGAGPLDAPGCDDQYKRIVHGWVRASWSLPLHVQDVVTNECPKDSRDEPQGRDCRHGSDGDLQTIACKKLSMVKHPTKLVSQAYRLFVNGYAQHARTPTDASLHALGAATRDLFDTSRHLACALMLASYTPKDCKVENLSAYCRTWARDEKPADDDQPLAIERWFDIPQEDGTSASRGP